MRGNNGMDELHASLLAWTRTDAFSTDVAAAVIETELCGEDDRQTALAALMLRVADGQSTQLSVAGSKAAGQCAEVLLVALKETGALVSLSLRYRTQAMQKLLELHVLSKNAILILRDAVYASAVRADRAAHVDEVANNGGAEDVSGRADVIDAQQQANWCERVGGWALATLRRRWKRELKRLRRTRRLSSRSRTEGGAAGVHRRRTTRLQTLQNRVRLVDSLTQPDDQRATVAKINGAIDKGRMTWPTKHTVAAIVNFDTELLSHLTTKNLQRRGELFFKHLLSHVKTDNETKDKLSVAMSQAMKGRTKSKFSTALLDDPTPFDVSVVSTELMKKFLRVRMRWYLEECGVKNEDAGYSNRASDHATHMDLMLAISIGG